MKTVYTVRTNHDGILGIFTNKKLAYREAKTCAIQYDVKMDCSYAQVCKTFKDTCRNIAYICEDKDLILEIEQYPLNNRY